MKLKQIERFQNQFRFTANTLIGFHLVISLFHFLFNNLMYNSNYGDIKHLYFFSILLHCCGEIVNIKIHRYVYVSPFNNKISTHFYLFLLSFKIFILHLWLLIEFKKTFLMEFPQKKKFFLVSFIRITMDNIYLF